MIENKGFLIPTNLGKKVYEFLSAEDSIKKFLSEEWTKELETLMDLVEEGKEDYVKILRELYDQILAVKVEEKP